MVMSHDPKQGTQAPWLDWMEKATIAGAVGGTVISALTQQLLFVSVPLSLAAALSFADRQRMKSEMASMAATSAATDQLLMIQMNKTHNLAVEKTESLAATSAAMNQLQMIQLNKTHNLAVEGLHTLQSQIENLQAQSEVMVHKQSELLGSTFEEGYYRRGLEYETKGEYKAAISAYSEALRLNPGYAISYMQRGLAYANLGQKQQAIADLRTATKMFFENGDLDNYHKARVMSEDVHGGSPAASVAVSSFDAEPVAERLVVDELFV
jgi:tetratricopeptide (TPR) repeat protein